MKKLKRLIGCLLLFVSTGCCVFPIPTERTLEIRKEITSEQISFITPGSTHREDVIRQLGEPYVEFPDLRIMVYTWVIRVGKVSGCVLPPLGLGAADLRNLYRYYTLLIAFDSADRVVKLANIVSWGDSENVREQALKWSKTLETQDLAVSNVSPMVVGQVIPPVGSALYIYWQPGFWNNSPFGGSWEVGVNGKVIGWIRRGEYIGITLAPGAHMVTVFFHRRSSWDSISIYFNALMGQAHYVSVGQPQWGGVTDPVLMVRSEGEALPVLKRMKPSP